MEADSGNFLKFPEDWMAALQRQYFLIQTQADIMDAPVEKAQARRELRP